ncbi:MAG: myo-inosose-2 dehydratase [Alphaproteobacteria bacterium]|nr:myo-inosose-2 dehydratase [Alphaproteobacteria bacterium]
MSIRFGVSPIAWANDDMPELGGDTPVETILSDADAIGFQGVELGGRFPREPKVLKTMLGHHGLDLVAGWYSSSLLTRKVDEEIAAAQDHLRLLKATGVGVWVHAETSNAIHGLKGAPLSTTPRLDEKTWKVFADRVTEFADYISGQGLRFAYHHHLGTVVERGQDLDTFLGSTGDAVGLTLDTGHAALGGIDAVAVIRRHADRIAHVHCKDVRPEVFERVESGNQSFLDGVLAGMFTVPGDGSLDFDAVMHALAAVGYDGWIVIEAEQDPAIAPPKPYGELGLQTLVAAARKAGLREAV